MLKFKASSVTSTTGPLWVAAFFLKKLKKAQVDETNIPFCVDKILHEKIDEVSYRVMAYLLLGVVKIYSKKVEYLLNEFDEVLIKNNKYANNINVSAPVETLCMSVARPQRFELDALDLGILEDSSRDHIASKEEITLKEVLYETEEPMRFSEEKFEDFDSSGNSDSLMTEEFISEIFGISMLSGRNNEVLLSVESLNDSQQVDNEDSMVKETSSSYQIHQEGVDVTPQSGFEVGSTSIGRPNPGAATPDSESVPLSTPSARQPSQFSRKRKAVFDKVIILPTELLNMNIEDASDLIANRKKSRGTLLSMQRQSRISRLSKGFNESLLPCNSKLQSLFSTKTLKIPKSLENVEIGQKSDVPESQTAGSQEKNKTAPEIPPTVCALQTFESPENIGTSPTTPLLCQNVTSQSMKHMEREQLLERNDIPMEEVDAISLNSHECLEMEQCFTVDADLTPMNEDVDSSDAETSHLIGWSERTRKVAKHLHKSFLDSGKQKEGDLANFSQVLEGRTRTECARLFHELLVLKSTSYVNVEQNKPYGDIAIKKLPKLDQTFGADT